MDRIKVMIVDDHEMVRVGLGYILKDEPGIEVVGEEESPQRAVAEIKEKCPDVVLMDIRFPDGSGVEACRELKDACPSIKVLMLTSYSDDEAILSSIVAGASGYLLKQIASDELIDSIKKVARGQSLLDPAITGRVLELMKNSPQRSHGVDLLNDKEKQILMLIAAGKTNNEIAAEVFLSPKTIKNYVSSILSKLNLHNRAEAAAFAVEHRSYLQGSK